MGSSLTLTWRTELPWLVVASTHGTFTRCGMCDYLRRLIDQCARGDPMLLVYQGRLGSHFSFQSACRLVVDRVEEICRQSAGLKWCMLTDKMDQNKTIVPTIWDSVQTPLFKLGDRLVAGIAGAAWSGTRSCDMFARTVFADCGHGANFQASNILLNIYDAAMREGHLPEELFINADNTYKETKNQYVLAFLIWFLCFCSAERLPTWSICLLFLLAG